MKILSVLGTRPEVIKMAPVIHQLKKDTRFDSLVCVTGQHRQMLDQTLREFAITPDIDLNIMTPDQDLFDVTTRVMMKLRPLFTEILPDRILVQGDTTTCFAASLAAFYLGIPIGHIEAGLRTGLAKSPFPEEMNRTLVSRLADLHFAPTPCSKQNLLDEGIAESNIHITGNTVIDALFWMREQSVTKPSKDIAFDKLATLVASDAPIILVTLHRRENFNSASESICQAIETLARAHPNWHFIYPTHLNPQARASADKLLANTPNIHLTPPLNYGAFVRLMIRSKLIITDSGGLQEEATALGKPVLVTREASDRPEALVAGTALLVGSSCEMIVNETETLMADPHRYAQVSHCQTPYGDGQAAKRIIAILANKLHEKLT